MPIKWIHKTSNALFMKIAEPRVVRSILFLIYGMLTITGINLLLYPPSSYSSVVDLTLVYVMGWFLIVGGVLSGVAVLPGVWWLERSGLFAITTALCMYLVLLVSLRASPVGISVSVALLLTLFLRWREIRLYQLAPREV